MTLLSCASVQLCRPKGRMHEQRHRLCGVGFQLDDRVPRLHDGLPGPDLRIVRPQGCLQARVRLQCKQDRDILLCKHASGTGAPLPLCSVDCMRRSTSHAAIMHTVADLTCITPGRRRLSAPSTAPNSTSSSGRLRTSRSTSRAPPVFTVTFMPPCSVNPAVNRRTCCHQAGEHRALRIAAAPAASAQCTICLYAPEHGGEQTFGCVTTSSETFSSCRCSSANCLNSSRMGALSSMLTRKVDSRSSEVQAVNTLRPR